LLIDELETGMSDLFLKRTLEAIRQYQRDNPTPIIITAMGAPVLDNADRVYRIENRSLIEEP
jgi:ABC-type branched-subunit amino acid transport system ATPase component